MSDDATRSQPPLVAGTAPPMLLELGAAFEAEPERYVVDGELGAGAFLLDRSDVAAAVPHLEASLRIRRTCSCTSARPTRRAAIERPRRGARAVR